MSTRALRRARRSPWPSAWLVLALASASAASAQPARIIQGAVTNGSATATSGGRRLSGAVGQAAVSRMASATFVITGGAFATRPSDATPSLTSVTPRTGSTAGGTRVVLRGVNLAPGATVSFGATAATVVSFVDATTLVAFAPAAAAGVVDVTVVSAAQRTTLAASYTYVAPPASSTTDADGDGMPDAWELRYSLDPANPADAGWDDDADGASNRQEFDRDSHPHGFYTRYLAEGASSSFFEMRIAGLNVTHTPAAVLLRYLKTDGTVQTRFAPVAPFTRATFDPATTLGTGAVEFSTTIESDSQVIADRTLTWDRANGFGAHAETSIERPSLEWYLAEGATHSGFNLFYLVQNPGATEAQVEVTYLLPSGAPLVKVYMVPANSRRNIWVNDEAATLPALASTDVSAAIRVTNGVPVIVERAMYLDTQGLTFGAGHESAAVTAAALNWFLAEGNTGAFFDLFILLANPSLADASVTATYLLPSGQTVTRTYTVAARSRQTVWVDHEDAQLADTAVSTTLAVTNGVPILVERALWWGGPTFAEWTEAHNSFGATDTGVEWALADGESGGARATATYLLIANTSPFAGTARVTVHYDDGSADVKTFALAPSSRFNVDVAFEFPSAAGRRYGTRVESLGDVPAQIVVERAMYSDALGVTWTAGTNAVATKLR